MVNDSDLIHTDVCVCVCVPLLWFPHSGMCRDLEDRAPAHLLNIRGNNSWADLKHGHPLHLAVSPRRSGAASCSRWQVAADETTGFPLPVSVWPPLAMLENKVGGIQQFQPTSICLLLLLLWFITCLLIVEINCLTELILSCDYLTL